MSLFSDWIGCVFRVDEGVFASRKTCSKVDTSQIDCAKWGFLLLLFLKSLNFYFYNFEYTYYSPVGNRLPCPP